MSEIAKNAQQHTKHTEQQDISLTLSANVVQRRAADPDASVWVGASAGTGKTKVLTDRVLRLLLPRNHDTAEEARGTEPHRILCLTYTKAAANEMALRINDTLADWAVMPSETLREKLKNLLDTEPSEAQFMESRRLFARVVDTPGGLKIMTIHSFCQSVLGRFPLEAGLPPYFELIEDTQSRALLEEAQSKILTKARQNPDSTDGHALKRLAILQNEQQFLQTLNNLCNERRQLWEFYEQHGTQALYKIFDLPTDITATDVLADFYDATPKESLYEAVRILYECGTKTDQERAINLKSWLELESSATNADLDNYATIFFTTTGTPRASLATKSAVKNAPHIIEILEREQDRLSSCLDTLKQIACARQSADLMHIGRTILDEYQLLKQQRAVLDFEDIILYTRALLSKNSTSTQWVLYKLDGGLDHILVDEAQDTNPEQWDIVRMLCDEFYTGRGQEQTERTLFIVGDKKQSIYSFQRAAPDKFDEMQSYFAERIEAANKTWRPVTQNISFRSTRTVLELVDRVFEDDAMRAGLDSEKIEHKSHRTGQAGLVELWPLMQADEPQTEAPWAPPITIQEQQSASAKLAEHIGETIKDWLERGEMLESHGRAVEAGDILILVRTRTALVNQIMKALKSRNIPVSGADRMKLTEQLPIMDLLAALQFAILPEDDLTLASLLKSPLIGLSEEGLYDMAIDRGGKSLWVALQGDPAYQPISAYLRTLCEQAQEQAPYAFLSALLQKPCPADHISGLRAIKARLGHDAIDPIDELLNVALSYEQEQLPSLQGFLGWISKENIEIKREQDDAGGLVRIMTVHGSKGLQAPIVIMPDTTIDAGAAARKTPRLLWPDKSGEAVPLWTAAKEHEPTLYEDARARVSEALEAESRRLLYVALTRAEDRLYIGGYRGKRDPAPQSWYFALKHAFESTPQAESIALTGIEEQGLRIYHPQTRDPDRAKKHKSLPEESLQTKPARPLGPAWLFEPAPEEPLPPRPLIPSRPSRPDEEEFEPAVRSPLGQDAQERFKRGNITHILLQILPDLPADQRRGAADQYLARPALNLSASLQNSIKSEIFAILENPEFAALFGENSMAEVPITGLIGDRLVSGQIDRLLIEPDKISIIDYKTNRPPPTDEKDLPNIYRTQLQSYRDIVAKIYNIEKINCYLLWTDGPNIMKVSLP